MGQVCSPVCNAAQLDLLHEDAQLPTVLAAQPHHAEAEPPRQRLQQVNGGHVPTLRDHTHHTATQQHNNTTQDNTSYHKITQHIKRHMTTKDNTRQHNTRVVRSGTEQVKLL